MSFLPSLREQSCGVFPAAPVLQRSLQQAVALWEKRRQNSEKYKHLLVKHPKAISPHSSKPFYSNVPSN